METGPPSLQRVPAELRPPEEGGPSHLGTWQRSGVAQAGCPSHRPATPWTPSEEGVSPLRQNGLSDGFQNDSQATRAGGKGEEPSQLPVQPHYGKQPSHSVRGCLLSGCLAWQGCFIFFSCFGIRLGAVVQPPSHGRSHIFLPYNVPVTRKCHSLHFELPRPRAKGG